MERRRPRFSLFFAVLLVLLTASPFTAPFQAVDLSVPAGELAGHDGISGDKVAKEHATPVFQVESGPLFHAIRFSLSVHHLIADHPRLLHPVLRL